MSNQNQALPSRLYAHPFDRKVKGDSATHGVGRDSDMIGGDSGIGWYETYRDRLTQECYRVHCSDGVYGGKSAHTDDDLDWMDRCQQDIMKRTMDEARTRRSPIFLSKEEWAIMLERIFIGWLDLLEGERYKTVGDNNRHLDVGTIGTINGVPVLVDPNRENPLESPPSQQQYERELERERMRLDPEYPLAARFEREY